MSLVAQDLFGIANDASRRTILAVVNNSQQNRMSATDTKKLGHSHVSLCLRVMAQFFNRYAIYKVQYLTLCAHAGPVFTDKSSFERNAARPVV